MEFFRHCPGCGRRFHIKLETKKLVGVEREKAPAKLISTLPTAGLGYSGAGPYYLVTEGVPMTIDREEFQYAYRCGHCGHEWSEKHVEERRERE